MKDMARLIPRDSPNHIIWFIRNFLLLVLNYSSAIIWSSGLIKLLLSLYVDKIRTTSFDTLGYQEKMLLSDAVHNVQIIDFWNGIFVTINLKRPLHIYLRKQSGFFSSYLASPFYTQL
jgi:hypothetical protein